MNYDIKGAWVEIMYHLVHTETSVSFARVIF